MLAYRAEGGELPNASRPRAMKPSPTLTAELNLLVVPCLMVLLLLDFGVDCGAAPVPMEGRDEDRPRRTNSNKSRAGINQVEVKSLSPSGGLGNLDLREKVNLEKGIGGQPGVEARNIPGRNP